MSNARTLANTINSSSQIVVPSGGVNFGTSTDGSGTVTGGILDDYEEGTWTANWTATGSAPTTPATATGHYTKIGKLVTCVVRFNNKNLSGASGEMRVNGLPFNVKDTGGSPQGVCTFFGQSFPTNTIYVTALVSGGYVFFLAVKEGAAWADVSITAGTGKYMELTVTYFAS